MQLTGSKNESAARLAGRNGAAFDDIGADQWPKHNTLARLEAIALAVDFGEIGDEIDGLIALADQVTGDPDLEPDPVELDYAEHDDDLNNGGAI